MGYRLSKIYTRTGDAGETGLGDGTRIDKDSLWVEAYGTVDELNSVIGMLLAHELPIKINDCLINIQHDLFDLGGELCMPNYQIITAAHVTRLENILDEFNADLPPLKNFILPSGTAATATCHFARTVCRRAERRVVSLIREVKINPEGLKYLNRLSDLLFVLARVLSRINGGTEVLWQRER
ncbi:cob(I)yrinic acid a,c-diamide adenosyltransferase [Beggiatoa leptomitoformis]|uniref:Corrinoid adenosyltransferase n=1 Tax=Beggiatoa leptomitoformis TaxID=288004 RepID=A0A2N9YBU4_9GAMM|nr:cob(I)yrinic acid a,c-diamide adenosyltransferase [Beggiatoa leptomitoformis]ALG66719.1 cob(I)yrinic acid a,c-diamide adenosyltransferase [Beggiatoa leptomitoformis]AUI67948.1 cob(I)yrinic acid a,c-diamide adenosyltransferase [Beggiatoa leptomitoformis]